MYRDSAVMYPERDIFAFIWIHYPQEGAKVRFTLVCGFNLGSMIVSATSDRASDVRTPHHNERK
jgi:hypothetical protein